MTKPQGPRPQDTDSSDKKAYNLGERTAKFGEEVIRFVGTIPRNDITGPLIRQLVRSSTSVGANYLEGDEAATTKEFRYRISLCAREAHETQYWIRMLVTASPDHRQPARNLWQEAKELTLISAAIQRKTKP